MKVKTFESIQVTEDSVSIEARLMTAFRNWSTLPSTSRQRRQDSCQKEDESICWMLRKSTESYTENRQFHSSVMGYRA